MRTLTLTAVCLAAVCVTADTADGQDAKNVVLMIADGRGFNALRATDYYTGTPAVYEGIDWLKLAMQTNSANNPAGYSPGAMAANCNYAKSGATDSAAAASAMFSGAKIRDGDINMTTGGSPLKTFFESAAQADKSIGAVSSVQLSHATPAAVYGHNTSRSNYSELALEAVRGSHPNSHNAGYDAGNYGGNLKVVMGAGHPLYDRTGQPQSADYKYVGGSAAWSDLGTGANGWTRIETPAEFQGLATGPTPDKVFGVAQSFGTLQQGRTDVAGSFDPMLTNQPTLVDMTRAALNVLDNNATGFAVMIEGGAIDWAGHANQSDRIIEEEMDFDASVAAVCSYLDASTNGNTWANTLVIITSDHETGHLWGDGTGTYFDVNGNGTFDAGVDYGHVVDNGSGVLPGMAFNSGSHTNALVPLFARGPGSELFADHVIGTDPNLAALYDLDGGAWSGQYVDNTSIYNVMFESAVPEPATMALLGLGLAGLVARARNNAGGW